MLKSGSESSSPRPQSSVEYPGDSSAPESQTQSPVKETKAKTPEESFQDHVTEMQRLIDWALSSFNRSRAELIDVCFAVYLEIYVKLFRVSAEYGRRFLKEFSLVFNDTFGHFIRQISEFLFPDQLANSPLIRQRVLMKQKYYVILSKGAMRRITGWMNNNESSIVDDVIKEGVEFLDGDTFNHSQGYLFRRHFIAKYGIDPTTVHKYRRPFHGMYIRDFDNELKVQQTKHADLLAKTEAPYVPLGLPGEILSEERELEYGRRIFETITGELAMLDEPDKLVPLPKPGTPQYQSLKGLFIRQRQCRVPDNSDMVLSYTFQNILKGTSCAISSFDGRYAALGLEYGGILLWDLVTSECSNAMKDITPVLGEGIATRSVSKSAGAATVSRLMQSKGNVCSIRNDQKESSGTGECILSGHDGSVQSLEFGEFGKVLLSGGVDGEVCLWVMGSKSTRCVYRGGGSPIMNIAYSPFGYYFATCEADGAARLWATDRSFPLRLLRTAQADCLGVVFHPNSSLLATPCSDGNIRFWDMRTASCDIVLEESPSGSWKPSHNHVTTIAKNGRLLASSNGNIVSIFDLYQRKRMQVLVGHTDTIKAMDFNNGTSELAVVDDSVLSLWDVKASRSWPLEKQECEVPDDFTKRMEKYSQFNESGTVTLIKACRAIDSQYRLLSYTPENVLLTLGLSTSRDSDNI